MRNLYLCRVVLWLVDGGQLHCFIEMAEELRRQGIAAEALLASEPVQERPGTLYITDHPDCAAHLCARGLPVLVYLHAGNRGADFGSCRYGMEHPEELSVEYLERVYRRYADLPWEILETERCVIRETVVEDVEAFYQIYEDPAITRYTEALYADKEDEKAYIRSYIDNMYAFYEYGVWTVLWKATGEIIGRAGFGRREGYELPELGFVIATQWQHRGIAYEICDAILAYGRDMLGFERVQTLVQPANKASLALCARLGFVEKGTVSEPDTITGEEKVHCYLEIGWENQATERRKESAR